MSRLRSGRPSTAKAARLYRLALENGGAGVRYHAVGEGGEPMGSVAEVIGRKLGVPMASIPPAAAPGHFGFLGMFALRDAPVSSRLTRDRLGWNPTGPGLLADLERLRAADLLNDTGIGS